MEGEAEGARRMLAPRANASGCASPVKYARAGASIMEFLISGATEGRRERNFAVLCVGDPGVFRRARSHCSGLHSMPFDEQRPPRR